MFKILYPLNTFSTARAAIRPGFPGFVLFFRASGDVRGDFL